MNHVNNHNQQGFTLIELTLAMAFIAMLMLAIALSIVQISQTYNQGLTYKEVDVTSRTISDDLTKDVNAAPQFALDSTHYVTQPYGGSLCLGRYSYVWNFGKNVSTYKTNPQPNSLNLLLDTSGTTSTLNMVKVLDVNGAMCADATAKKVPKANAVELLQSTDHDLAIHEVCMSTQPSAGDTLTGQRLYTLSYSIGTNNANALTSFPVSGPVAACGSTEGDSLQTCKDPSQNGSDLEYCTVQEFSLVLRAQNGVN